MLSRLYLDSRSYVLDGLLSVIHIGTLQEKKIAVEDIPNCGDTENKL